MSSSDQRKRFCLRFDLKATFYTGPVVVNKHSSECFAQSKRVFSPWIGTAKQSRAHIHAADALFFINHSYECLIWPKHTSRHLRIVMLLAREQIVLADALPLPCRSSGPGQSDAPAFPSHTPLHGESTVSLRRWCVHNDLFRWMSLTSNCIREGGNAPFKCTEWFANVDDAPWTAKTIWARGKMVRPDYLLKV